MSSFFSSLKLRFAALARSPRKAAWAVAALAVPAVLAAALISALAPALDRSDEIPVAVVNLDEGTQGAELVESLADAEDVSWREVDEDAATAGLADGSYALALVIPADYTEKVESVESDDPQKASIDIVSDGTGNVLATCAGTAVMRQVQSRLKSDLGERYLLNVLNDVRGQASRLTLTADGSTMLDTGYDALSEGATAIATALAQTGTAASQLTDGLGQMGVVAGAAAGGAGALGSGLAAVQEQAVQPVAEGASALLAGMDALSGQMPLLAEGAAGLRGGIALLEQVTALDADTMAGINKLTGDLDGQAETLTHALAAAGTSIDDATTAVEAAASAVGEETRGEAAAVATGLDELAARLSSREGEGGISEQAGELSSNLALAQEKLSSLVDGREQEPSSAPAGTGTASQADEGELAADGSTVDEEAAAVIREVIKLLADTERDANGVSDLAAETAEGAAGLADESRKVSSGLEEASDAADALERANAELAAAQGAAADASAAIQETVGGGASAIGALQVSVNGAQAILAGKDGMTLSGVASGLEAGITLLGGQLSEDGSLGQGVAGLAVGTSAINQALTPFASATDQLAKGVSTLGAALSGIGSGASGLGTGLGALSSAAGQLATGTVQLKDANAQMMKTVGKAADALSAASSASAERAEVASSPVAFNSVRENEVDSTQAAVAPAFIAAALWAGALLSMLVLPPFDMRAVLAGRSARGALSALVPYVLFGLAQAALIGAVCTLFCGVGAASPAAFWGLLAGGTIAFAIIAQAIRALFGRWAVLASVILLVLQLLSAGAILPEALSSGSFAAPCAALPVPALATALRGAVSGTLAGAGSGAAVLACFAAAAVAVTLAVARSRRTVRPERLAS